MASSTHHHGHLVINVEKKRFGLDWHKRGRALHLEKAANRCNSTLQCTAIQCNAVKISAVEMNAIQCRAMYINVQYNTV